MPPLVVVNVVQLLLYPTAIGSEPQDPTINSSAHWRRVMQGHAAVGAAIKNVLQAQWESTADVRTA